MHPRVEVSCLECGEHFSKSVDHHRKKYCSKKCASTAAGRMAALARGERLQQDVVSVCQHCEGEFKCRTVKCEPRKFCSSRCAWRALSVNAKGTRSDAAMLARWIDEFGKETAEQKFNDFKRKQCESSLGRTHSEESRRKISLRKVGKPNPSKHKGKTRIEILGEERARIALERSRMTCHRNFLNGSKIVSFPSIAVRARTGSYRGLRFRSLLELQFLLMLERSGIDLLRDVVVEPKQCMVEWIDAAGRAHVYQPDFLVVSRNTVYEIKDPRYVEDGDVVRKAVAAIDHFEALGMKYEIVCPRRLTTREAISIENVVLNEMKVLPSYRSK